MNSYWTRWCGMGTNGTNGANAMVMVILRANCKYRGPGKTLTVDRRVSNSIIWSVIMIKMFVRRGTSHQWQAPHPGTAPRNVGNGNNDRGKTLRKLAHTSLHTGNHVSGDLCDGLHGWIDMLRCRCVSHDNNDNCTERYTHATYKVQTAVPR